MTWTGKEGGRCSGGEATADDEISASTMSSEPALVQVVLMVRGHRRRRLGPVVLLLVQRRLRMMMTVVRAQAVLVMVRLLMLVMFGRGQWGRVAVLFEEKPAEQLDEELAQRRGQQDGQHAGLEDEQRVLGVPTAHQREHQRRQRGLKHINITVS